MEEYYFLFILAFIFTGFATIQDLRKREVANWLNFSFVAFALAYRAFYAVLNEKADFFYFGLFGFVLFYAIAEALYYAGAFGGGDARLLRAFGAVLPFESFSSMVLNSFGFVFLLFFIGAGYTLIWSVFLVSKNSKNFRKEFAAVSRERKPISYASLGIIIVVLLTPMIFSLKAFALLFLILIPLLYYYLKAVEKSCLVKLVKAKELTVGDWLEMDVRAGRNWIRKSVHGLSIGEIQALRRTGKKVWVKEGIPFVPVFLITLIVMEFFYLILKHDFAYFLKFLF